MTDYLPLRHYSPVSVDARERRKSLETSVDSRVSGLYPAGCGCVSLGWWWWLVAPPVWGPGAARVWACYYNVPLCGYPALHADGRTSDEALDDLFAVPGLASVGMLVAANDALDEVRTRLLDWHSGDCKVLFCARVWWPKPRLPVPLVRPLSPAAAAVCFWRRSPCCLQAGRLPRALLGQLVVAYVKHREWRALCSMWQGVWGGRRQRGRPSCSRSTR